MQTRLRRQVVFIVTFFLFFARLAPASATRALVLGGGGLAGIGWETGVLTGLADRGFDARRFDIIIGTSAGSAVGALVAGGLTWDEMFRLLVEPNENDHELAPPVSPLQLGYSLFRATFGAKTPLEMRQRVGSMALAAGHMPEAEWRRVIASRLPVREWPRTIDLKLVAVDAVSGEPKILDRDSGASLSDAVAASCAVPGAWPPVTIGAHRYMDGGTRSLENADLAAGYDEVLVLSARSHQRKITFGENFDGDIARLRAKGSQVVVLSPDAESAKAMGPNPLDPSVRAASARAGREQGKSAFAQVSQW